MTARRAPPPPRRSRPIRPLWLLALALVAMRALVPAGFMPGIVDGQPSIVLCAPGVMDTSRGAMPMHLHGAHRAPSTCPYAQSAAPALTPAIAPPPGRAPASRVRPVPVFAHATADNGPKRHQSPRAPPSPLASLS